MALLFAKNNSLSAVTALPASISGGGLNLISTQTASSSATIDFTSGIDSTYKEYIFKFYDIHPATDGTRFTFQGDTGTNTNYNQTITSSFFYAQQGESEDPLLAYGSGQDQAQATGFQDLSLSIDSDGNDSSCSGYLHIFDPSNTTFAKHFIGLTQIVGNGYYSYSNYSGGYFNITTALTRFQFKMSSGNIDSGLIKLYGVT